MRRQLHSLRSKARGGSCRCGVPTGGQCSAQARLPGRSSISRYRLQADAFYQYTLELAFSGPLGLESWQRAGLDRQSAAMSRVDIDHVMSLRNSHALPTSGCNANLRGSEHLRSLHPFKLYTPRDHSFSNFPYAIQLRCSEWGPTTMAAW